MAKQEKIAREASNMYKYSDGQIGLADFKHPVAEREWLLGKEATDNFLAGD